MKIKNIIKKILEIFIEKKPIDLSFTKENYHFTYKRVVKSTIAKRYKIDNSIPNDLEIQHNIGHTNLRITAILTDVLNHFNKKWSHVIITSWFRCWKLNKKVGGSETSEHPQGKAVDFKIKGLTPKQICDYINSKYYAYNQLILEPSWIHISFDSSPFLEKGEYLIKTKTGYIEG